MFANKEIMNGLLYGKKKSLCYVQHYVHICGSVTKYREFKLLFILKAAMKFHHNPRSKAAVYSYIHKKGKKKQEDQTFYI
jgi:hypothetical protein